MTQVTVFTQYTPVAGHPASAAGSRFDELEKGRFTNSSIANGLLNTQLFGRHAPTGSPKKSR